MSACPMSSGKCRLCLFRFNTLRMKGSPKTQPRPLAGCRPLREVRPTRTRMSRGSELRWSLRYHPKVRSVVHPTRYHLFSRGQQGFLTMFASPHTSSAHNFTGETPFLTCFHTQLIWFLFYVFPFLTFLMLTSVTHFTKKTIFDIQNAL